MLLSLLFSLAFPPFVVDRTPGETKFLGWRSLFTQSDGYISWSRLVLFWLLVLAVAWCVQMLGEKWLGAAEADKGPSTLFGCERGKAPLSGSALLAVVLALPFWLVACGALVGRRNILGLEEQLASLASSAFWLVVLSRLLLLTTRDRTSLALAYGVLCSLGLGWDLRTADHPPALVGGLVPVYALLGFLLYRFDLRFVEVAVVRPAATTPGAGSSPLVGAAKPTEAEQSVPERPLLAQAAPERPLPNALTEPPVDGRTAGDDLAAPRPVLESKLSPLESESDEEAPAVGPEVTQPAEPAPAPSEPAPSERATVDPYSKYRPKN